MEDLRALLAYAKRRTPDLGGVCCGALLSDYQRLRVESVASSLGLTSLAPLWRLNQLAYMHDVVREAGMKAVLVKVAALGLRPADHLGSSLSDMLPLLTRLHVKHGCHAAGEGGEYETLVLDCPAFTRGRLVLDATRMSTAGGDVGHLHVEEWHVELKPGGDAIPAVEIIHVDDVDADSVAVMATPAVPSSAYAELAADSEQVHVAVCKGSRGNGCTATLSARATCTRPDAAGTAFALKAALTAIADALGRLGSVHSAVTWSDVAFVHLYLPDMDHFAAANAAYVAIVPLHAPPSRACVAHAGGSSVIVDATVFVPDAASCTQRHSRRVMHVQSISGWAPACIGPYAQAVCIGDRLLFVAGQLGLVPSTMALPSRADQDDDSEEAMWAVRSADAVATAMGAPLRQAAALAVTMYATSERACAVLRGAWADLLRGRTKARREYALDFGESVGDVGDRNDGASDPGQRINTAQNTVPLELLVLVPALPRGAAVEVQPLCRTINTAQETAMRRDAHAVYLPRSFLRAYGRSTSPGGETEAVASLQASLQSASLTWDDIACLRLYVASKDEAAVQASANAWRAALEAAVLGGGTEHVDSGWLSTLSMVVVPVKGVATSGESDVQWLHSLLELTALRIVQ